MLLQLFPLNSFTMHAFLFIYLFSMLCIVDIALDLLNYCPRLAITPDDRESTFLGTLASIPSAFPSGCQLSFWQRWIYKSKYRIKLSLKCIVSVICFIFFSWVKICCSIVVLVFNFNLHEPHNRF